MTEANPIRDPVRAAMQADIDLLRSILRGYPASIASTDGLAAVARLQAALAEPAWVSVSERLPPPHTDFIALNRDGRIFRSRMCYGMHAPWFTYPRGDKDASDTMPEWIDVTHWQPFEPPSPPTEEPKT